MSLFSTVGSASATRRRQSRTNGERAFSASSAMMRQASRSRGFTLSACRAQREALR